MLTLAIETSNPSAARGAGVALGTIDAGARTATLLAVENLRESARHDDDLMPAIDRLVRGAGRSPKDLDLIAVSVGPGGYTGLRIAVATANMIAFATGTDKEEAAARTIPVPTALVVARRITPNGHPLAVALASKDNTTCITLFDAHGRALDPHHPTTTSTPQIITEAELESLGIARLIADQFLPKPIRARAESLGIAIEPPTFDPAACLECAATISPAPLAPIYAREPEAVTLWRKRTTP